MLKRIVLLAAFIAMVAQIGWAKTFKIDPAHSQVRFSVPHMVMFTVRGAFTDFSGTIEANVANKSLQSVEGTVAVASIDTREAKRDAHLKSPDFFAVEQYPEITFKDTKIIGSGNNITVIGDLTIRGITNRVTLTGRYLGQMSDPWGNVRVGFLAHGKINRHNFGVKWNQVLETGGVMVGKEVQITLEIQAIQQK